MVEIKHTDLKPQVYRDPRPPEYFRRFHDRARSHQPSWMYDLVRLLLTPVLLLFFRVRAIGADNVPARGAFILTPNHFSQMDHFLAGVYLRRKIRFMAKSQLFANKAIEFIFYYGGVFPVMRGRHDQEAFITAHEILRQGHCLGMYAEGGRSRTGKLGEPKRGVGRLALESGVPVVPVAIHGSAGIRAWKRFRFPKVTVQFGEPLSLPHIEDSSPEQQQQAAEQVFDRVRAMYEQLDRVGRRGVLRAIREGLPPGSAADPTGGRPPAHSS